MKKDENKETMLEKAKRKANSAKEKAVCFWNENGEMIVLIGTGVVGIAGTILFAKHVCKKAEEAALHEEQIKKQCLSLMERGSAWREEDYRESWDAVNSLAGTLNLKPGEEYIITAPGTYVGQDELAVSHMIDGTGVYPPDEDEKPEVEGE